MFYQADFMHVVSIRAEDFVHGGTKGGPQYSIRKLHLKDRDGEEHSVNVFAEEGSALDLEIRANVAAKAERERAA